MNTPPHIEIDEEAIVINGERFDAPPTLRELAGLFQSNPRFEQGEKPMEDWKHWIWDGSGFKALGKSENDLSCLVISLTGGEERKLLPQSSFPGRLDLFGHDPRETQGMDALSQQFHQLSYLDDGGLMTNSKSSYAGGKTSVSAVNVMMFRGDRIEFGFPSRSYVRFPIASGLKSGERILGALRGWVDFSAIVTNQRLIVSVPGSPIFQWSLRDLRTVEPLLDCDANPRGEVLEGWKATSWFILWTDKLRKRPHYQPPYHALEIIPLSGKNVSILTTRHFNGDGISPDVTRGDLQNFADCVVSAIVRHRNSAPPLASEESGVAASIQNEGRSNGTISCPCCGQPVSPQASHCPKCAQPITGGMFRVNRSTHEKTSKSIKMGRVIGRLAVLASSTGLIADFLLNSASHFLILVTLLVLSAAFLSFLRFSHWWHHE
ncbi:MAG TPA: zinc ribbon domain-containing protein [Chthoniobacteraceae bacterium]|jgi:hypothetical protein|nr:zinc ribbon domain-containing protein [Chthoniobacteraceae bacterium]